MKNKKLLLVILVILILGITGSTIALGAGIKLKLGHCVPPGAHQYHQASLYFGDLIKEKTNGEYEIEVFPSELLAPPDYLIGVKQ